ncbi:hypothetical protein NK6_5380 [Bradyrhizobium diazoefficiens]|uniref:Uncharacterized protein n=1 Tax=Bradyrhizobium diazoefficiens TaxID=1355477 RepID=A0A0E4BQZ8_9BRAD|nr:hypothetical protein NK6_5380 [Bradyrhizobium diazoefficiens]
MRGVAKKKDADLCSPVAPMLRKSRLLSRNGGAPSRSDANSRPGVLQR